MVDDTAITALIDLVMQYKFIHLNKTHVVNIKKSDGGYQVTIDGKDYDIAGFSRKDNIISFKLHKNLNNIYYAQDKDTIYLAVGGDYYTLVLERGSVFKGTGAQVQKGDSVKSPMPGLLVKVMVMVGDEVKEGTSLAIVEAMKMQNELRAPRDGVIKKINYKEGDQVEVLKPIVELE